jgi:hypothetical protein
MFIQADQEVPPPPPPGGVGGGGSAAGWEEPAVSEEGKVASKKERKSKRIKVNARQLRRNAKIVSLLMHPEHRFGVGLWQDSGGVQHGCGPLAWRDAAVRGLADAVAGAASAAKASEGLVGKGGLFSAPEDAITGLLSRNDLVTLLRILGWKRLHADWKAGNYPEHMAKFVSGKFWARMAPLPLARGSDWKAKGEGLDLWKQDARSLLDMTAWQDAEPDAEGAAKDSRNRALLYLKDVFEIAGKSLKDSKFGLLVACVGVWLEWHHPGRCEGGARCMKAPCKLAHLQAASMSEIWAHICFGIQER